MATERRFDPEYDDPFGAGWIISDEYWGDDEEAEGNE